MRRMMMLLTLLFTWKIIISAQGIWTRKADFAGTARSGAIGFSIGNKGYIGTGLDVSVIRSDFWEYDPVTNIWTQKANFGGAEKFWAVGFSIGSKGFIGTGSGYFGNRSDFWEYDPTSNTWARKADFGGTSRYFAVGFSIGSKGYIGTGYGGGSRRKDFWEYNPDTNSWTQKADFGGVARDAAVGFSIKSKGYIGFGFDGTNTLRDFWEYDPQSNNWIQKAHPSEWVFGGSYGVGFSIFDKGYIGTGNPVNFSLLFEYNPKYDIWTRKADFPGVGRISAAGFSISNKGYIGTGFGYGGLEKKDFWEYDPDARHGFISGKLLNKNTRVSVAAATVVTSTGYQATSNLTGNFQLVVPSARGYSITISASGYLTKSLSDINVSIGDTTKLGIIYLTPIPIEEYNIIGLHPDPNPETSEVQDGGSFVRYYQVVGKSTGVPVNGIPVEFERIDRGVTKSFVSNRYGDLDGVVKIEFTAVNVRSNMVDTFKLKSVNNSEPDTPITFFAKVSSRKYSKSFEIDRNINIDLGIAIGGHASGGIEDRAFARLIVEELDGNIIQPDSSRIEQEFQSAIGVSVGVGAGVKVGAGPVSGGIYGGLSGGLYQLLRGKGNYRYQYSSVDDNVEARSKMLNVALAALTLNPIPWLSRAAFLLAGISNWNYLDYAEAGIGAKGEGEGYAMAGVFTNRQMGIGLGGYLGGGFEGSATINVGYRKPEEKFFGSFNAYGSVEGNLGLGFLFWKYDSPGSPKSEGLNKIKSRTGWGGIEAARIPLFSRRNFGSFRIGTGWDLQNLPTIEFSTTKGTDSWERKFALSFGSGQLESIIRASALKSLFSISRENREILSMPTLGLGFLNSAMDEALTTIMEKQINSSFPPIPYTVDSSATSSSGGFTIDIDWAIALRLKLDAVGINWRTSHNSAIERGVYYGFNEFPLERYSNIPRITTPMKDVIKKIFEEGLATFSLGELFESVCIFGCGNAIALSSMDSLILLSPNGSNIKINLSSLSPEITSLTCQTWNWYGNTPIATLTQLPLKERDIALTIKNQQQNLAGLDYGIGGFYKFTPQGIPLSSPAVLTIVYPDSDVVGISETNLAIFYQDTIDHKWKYLGGTVDTTNNRVTVSVDTLQLFTIAPISPDGLIRFKSSINTLQSDTTNMATIWADSLRLNDGRMVGSNVPYTIRAEKVAIVTSDADPATEGIQVYSSNSRIEFQVRGNHTPGKAVIRVESVKGSSYGTIELVIIDTVKPEAPTIASISGGDQSATLIITKPEDSDIVKYEVHFDNNSIPPFTGRALAGGQDSPISFFASDTHNDTLTVPFLRNDTTYFLAVRGIDAGENLSDFSNILKVVPRDTIPPGKIDSLEYVKIADSTYLLKWIASGDNGNEGRATRYIMKVSNQAISNLSSWWASADSVENLTSPNNPGEFDYHIIKSPFGDTFYVAIVIGDESGNISDTSIFGINILVGVKEDPFPTSYALFQNYPNPFNPNTVIKYQLPVSSKVTLKIYNILGQEVKTLLNEFQVSGFKMVEWKSINNAGNIVASGVYFYRIEATSIVDPGKTFTQVRKMLLIR